MPHGLPIGQMVDPYRVLGVSPEAGEEAIQAAYRRLARAFHPDVNHTPEAGARMREINAAYALLRDRTRRAAFTTARPAPSAAPPVPPPPAPAGSTAAGSYRCVTARWWGWTAGPVPTGVSGAVALWPIQPQIVTASLVAGFGVLVAVLAAWALLVVNPFGSALRAPSSAEGAPVGRVATIGGPSVGGPATATAATTTRPQAPPGDGLAGTHPPVASPAAPGERAEGRQSAPAAAGMPPTSAPAPEAPAGSDPGHQAAIAQAAPARPSAAAPQATPVSAAPPVPQTVPQRNIQAIAAQQLAGPPSVVALQQALSAFDRAWMAYSGALRLAAAGELDTSTGRTSLALRGGGAALLSTSGQLGLTRAVYLDAQLAWSRQRSATLAALPPAADENGEAWPEMGLQAQADLRLGQAASLLQQAQAMGTVSSLRGQISMLLDDADRLHAGYVAAWARYLAQWPA